MDSSTINENNEIAHDINESNEIAHDFSPYFRVHKDGHIHRFHPPQFSPSSDHPQSPVRSKDVIISPQSGVSARLYLPQTTKKLPLLVHIHGGAFCLGSVTNPTFHNYMTSLVSKSTVVAVSIEYRLAPEHPLPTAYDDSWTALQWIASHADGSGPDPWLNDHADFNRVYLSGESAGANIASDVVLRAGVEELGNGFKIWGLVLVQPYFGVKEVDKMYKFMCPSSSGSDDDPRLNPAVDPRLEKMGCSRVLVVVAEKDGFRERGRGYYELLKKTGLGGEVEIMEVEGVGHGYHLFDPTCEKALTQLSWVASFLNKE